MKTIIMAGGRGTRIRSVATDIPKPMIKIAGKPVLEHEIECLREQGFTDIILTVSHLSSVITDYFGDGSKISPATGNPFGVKIEYYIEETPLGNAGALFKLWKSGRLGGSAGSCSDFLLLNADAVFHIDFNRFVAFHQSHGGMATLFTHPNSHPYDSGLIISDSECRVVRWLTKEEERPEYYKNRVNAGLHVINTRIFDTAGMDADSVGRKDPEGKLIKVDLDRQLLKPLAGRNLMFVYDSPEYVKDMGTPERYEAVCRDFQNGKIAARNLGRRQKAVFLDRDGTINEYVGFLNDIEKFHLLPRVSEAVRAINDSGYLAIVVTNQPVVARGEVTFKQLDRIHNKMETLLGQEGAYLDAVYYCPHHSDQGFKGEVPGLKVDCSCRKPKPGMLLQAAEKYHLDLSSSWMIGDDERDIKAGKAAGCRTVLVGRHQGESDDYGQDAKADNLFDAVEFILNFGAINNPKNLHRKQN